MDPSHGQLKELPFYIFGSPSKFRTCQWTKIQEAFEKWVLDYNKVKVIQELLLPTRHNYTFTPHAKQKDGTTCGIWTLWFAKQILEDKQIMHVDIAREGAFIATEVMDTSEPLQHLCHKCGLLLSSNNYQVKMCQGNCRPCKVFHLNCTGEKYHQMIKFCCQVCDNHNREEGCYSCGGEISD